MSAQHTPGPWEIVGRFFDIYQAESSEYICQSSKSQGERREANARLISAAPELLWFTQQIFNGLDTGMIRMETPADETLANILHKGRAAINKAEGRA